ncbi:nitroreductase [Paraburkholderia sp. CNPSo 3272]|uniref:nitroreductase n=1 Tax=Paraburkholderia sp. CNPSo 3272 TaxID=2940931 RepID=UPI0020B8C6AA|nr:nitroreductase [Paraburkholderia sp. CNPSo 3272]MCP3728578.1 nitroreductase [Paraburkholderia sp. CNPSo 3272]
MAQCKTPFNADTGMNRLSPPPLNSFADVARAVDWALVTRRSVRAFLPTPVPREQIEAILDVARFSATGVNIQPWHVHVVTGAMKSRLSAAIHEINDDPGRSSGLDEPYDYYPREWIAPYVDRRRAVGWNLYGLLGIEKGDKERMHVQHGRNYSFFDAPVGLFFTVDRVMREGSLLDTGMFLQSVMIAARARGLDTCPQAAFNKFHRAIAHELSIPDSQMLVCGMSLGYADHSCIENTLVTARSPVRDFTTFYNE